MKKISLTKIHQQLDVKMTGFTGYNIPVQYEDTSVGVSDVYRHGEFIISGN